MKLRLYITNLWNKKSNLSFLENIIFFFLILFEYPYRFFFCVVLFFKKKFGQHDCKDTKVISVGNISVGGTGKTVFVKFLAKKIGRNSRCAIFLRGYGRDTSGGKESFVVDRSCFNSRVIGDEACEYLSDSELKDVLIVVGGNRLSSFFALKNYCNKKKVKVDYIILDDSYQNFKLKKNFEFLLIDARSPFGNGHCLPAGPLREKDFSRANKIIITHSDEVDSISLNALIKELSKKVRKENIVCGKHVTKKIEGVGDWKDKRFLAVAGIGSFSGFINSLDSIGVNLCDHLEYPDHFNYTSLDVEKILKKMKASSCDCVVTTDKDWQKLKFIVKEKNLFYILKIGFEFSGGVEIDFF